MSDVLLEVRKLSDVGYGLQAADKLTCPRGLDTKTSIVFLVDAVYLVGMWALLRAAYFGRLNAQMFG